MSRSYNLSSVDLGSRLVDIHDVPEVGDVFGRIAVYHQDIGGFARVKGTDFVVNPA